MGLSSSTASSNDEKRIVKRGYSYIVEAAHTGDWQRVTRYHKEGLSMDSSDFVSQKSLFTCEE